MPLFVIGLSHRTSRVEVREKFAFSEESVPEVLGRLRANGLADEAVILSTCNRVELYVATSEGSSSARHKLERFLVEERGYDSSLNGEVYLLKEPQSIEHLFKVACGLDSMVLGETEILGQLKRAYDLALQHRHTGTCLNKAFQKAFNVAKQVRTHTNIQRGSISVSSVAVELAEKIFSSLAERTVMVVGAGEMGEKTARALSSRGVKNILVSNRSLERAQALATALGGRALPSGDWSGEFGKVDIIVSSTSATGYVLDRAKLQPLLHLRGSRPLLLIDIAVPRDIEPEVNFLDNVFLYNIDDLQSIADSYLRQRQEEIARCEAIIRERAQALCAPNPAYSNVDDILTSTVKLRPKWK